MSLSQSEQTAVKSKRKRKIYKKCNECKRRRKTLDESHQICHFCYKIKAILKPSGNKVIDDFIKYTQSNYIDVINGKLEFVPYDHFKDIEFIAEGGFSKIYKAIWADGPMDWHNYNRMNNNYAVVLKKLNNSKGITSKELNELKVYYGISSKSYHGNYNISKYFGITQDPITQDIMIIMPYYSLGDLTHYMTDFYSISWMDKLGSLQNIISGLKKMHHVNIVHRDLHSGNIFFNAVEGYYKMIVVIGDLGISKSATELSTDDNIETYGIIPYMAPEIFQGKKYTTASDIYSFGMIMWEFMTGRRPFWNKIHDTELIIEICDGLRPPIVTNAPEGYIELVKECWHPDPEKRPSAVDVHEKIQMCDNEYFGNPTKIIKSPNIGPVTMNNSGAIYKSRLLSGMIQSAMSTRSTSINSETDYFTKEIELDIT